MRTRSTYAAAENQQMSDEGAVGPIRHCKSCATEDNSRMVQCDKCDDWYHFNCVGVNYDIVHHDWLCHGCEVAKGAKKKTSKNVPGAVLPVSTYTSANPTIRVTSAPLNVVPKMPANLPALPSLSQSANTHVSTLTNVPSNLMFPPLSVNHASHAPIPSHTVNVNTLLPPSTFALPNTVVSPSTVAHQNPYPGTAIHSSCLTTSSNRNQQIPSIANIPLASSTIIPATVPLTGQFLSTQSKLTYVQARNNAEQGFGDTASQHSGVSKKSVKQKQLQLELQRLDDERKLQEQEDTRKR